MRIRIKPGGSRGFSLRMPTRLVLNSFTAGIFVNNIEKESEADEVDVAQTQALREGIKALFREIYRMKDKYPGLIMLQVEAADGTEVEIKL